MAAANSPSTDDVVSKAVHKRYQGLVMVRTKAMKGKGAWYWTHLEPILVNNSDTGLPKAVKLRCSLCDAVFSASNPSRTATEHLKRGTCLNFNSSAKPISAVSPLVNHRKRNSYSVSGDGDGGGGDSDSFYDIPPLTVVDPSHLMLSGGKEDLGALAMLESSVKRLKSPRISPGLLLNKAQIDSAFDFLADWVYESFGSVSISNLEHPKFRAFLNQVGLPPVSGRDFARSRLDFKYEKTKADLELRISDAMFFQIASNGWKRKRETQSQVEKKSMVHMNMNLPNGTSLYRKTLFFSSESVPSEFAEEVLWDTVSGLCRNDPQKCVGIVADKFKSKALRSLEIQNQWMVNLSCQFQGFISLVKDFIRKIPLFKNVADKCKRVAYFFNYESQIRIVFHKYQLQECGHACLIRLPPGDDDEINFLALFTLVEDILDSAQAIQLARLDESFKKTSIEDPIAREVSELVGNSLFWSEVEAVHCLIKLVKDMAQDIQTERPLIGQCLPLWDELKEKVKDWCSKFHVPVESVEKLIERRFKKNYHPAWAAAFVLDPLYLIRDTSGKYLPPFKCLTIEQEKDVDRLITRLVSTEEAHIALMELMKWRTEGLDHVYARAVQMKEKDPITGKLRIANPQSSRLVWETHLNEFKSLGKVAVRLIFLHATSCGFKSNVNLSRMLCSNGYSTAATERIQKLIFISAHSKLENRNFSPNDDADVELLAASNSEEDDIPNGPDR